MKVPCPVLADNLDVREHASFQQPMESVSSSEVPGIHLRDLLLVAINDHISLAFCTHRWGLNRLPLIL